MNLRSERVVVPAVRYPAAIRIDEISRYGLSKTREQGMSVIGFELDF